MKEKQDLLLSTFAAKMTNCKYVSQRKKLLNELKSFRDHYNYNRALDFLLPQE